MVYVLPVQDPLRFIEEICMLDQSALPTLPNS
jgi:hypothetical protein